MTRLDPAAAAEEEEARVPRDSSVGRVVAVIDALTRGDRDGIGVRELAAHLGISRSVVHRVLANLAELRVAESCSGGRYAPGVMMLSWAGRLHKEDAILTVGRAVVAEVVADVGETAMLTTYADGDHHTTVVIAQDSSHPLRYHLSVGQEVPLHTGGSGKSILAQLPDSVVDELSMERLTDTTTVDRAELREELREIARCGYATSFGENTGDASGVGAAFEIDGRVAGSVCIVVPTVRLEESMVPALGARIRNAAALLTDLLSNHPRAETEGDG